MFTWQKFLESRTFPGADVYFDEIDPSLNGNTQEGNLEKMAIYYNFRNNKTQNFRSIIIFKVLV